MSDWISVKDRLPNKDGKYLCCWGFNGHKSINIYSFAKNLSKVDKYDFRGKRKSGWYDYDSEWGYGEMSGVTHWMPLPELPKERRFMGSVSLIDGHIDGAEYCVCCGAVIPEGRQHCIICGKKVNGKQRQIDRIRNMSVEELAEFLLDVDYIGECPLPKESCRGKNGCNDCVKQWLESEVTE